MKLTKFKASILIIITISIGIPTAFIISNYLNRIDVRLGYLQGDIHHLAFFVAQSKGYYDEEGISVEAIKLANGGIVMAAFESLTRTIDMSYLGFAPAIWHKFNAENANVTVVSAVNVNGSALVVKNDGTINSISDLNGKIVAVPALNNMQDFILRLALDTDPLMQYEENITVVSPLVTLMGLQLETGSIDAYVAWEPYNAQQVVGEDAKGKYLLNSSEIWPNHPCCVIAAHNDFLQDRPDLVEKILQVHVKATNFILNPTNHNELIGIAVNHLGITPEIAETAINNVGYVYSPDFVKMEEFIDKLVQFGTVSMSSEHIPSNITTHAEFIEYFVDTSILNQVTASL